jgi:hypothetical protein
MIKVQILDRCSHCDGEAYLPVAEAESYTGERYTRYEPCTQCQGSGKQIRWVSLKEFYMLITEAQCPHEQSSFQGGYHFSGGDVWDDITEICNDCGTNLDK